MRLDLSKNWEENQVVKEAKAGQSDSNFKQMTAILLCSGRFGSYPELVRLVTKYCKVNTKDFSTFTFIH